MFLESEGVYQASETSTSVLDRLERESYRKLHESPAYKAYDRCVSQYSGLSLESKRVRDAWMTESVLAASGRDVHGPDGAFVLLPEDDYMEMIVEMVDRMRGDERLQPSVKSSHQLSPLEGNSLCPVHPYGSVIGYCECGKPLGRIDAYARERITGCSCPDRFHLAHASSASGVVFYTQHVIGGEGVCLGVKGLDDRLSVIDKNLPMFARLARFLFSYANNQFVVREVLGGPYSGYLQAAVMVALRFSVSDTVRVASWRCDRLLRDGVFKNDVGSDRYMRGIMSLRQQGFFRGWMNNIVQNRKRAKFGEAKVSDNEFRESFKIRGKTVVIDTAPVVSSTTAQGRSEAVPSRVPREPRKVRVERTSELAGVVKRLMEVTAEDRMLEVNRGLSPDNPIFHHSEVALAFRERLDGVLQSYDQMVRDRCKGWEFLVNPMLPDPGRVTRSTSVKTPCG